MINRRSVDPIFNLVSFLQDVKFPDEFGANMKNLLGGLLQRTVSKRIGCKGEG